PATERRSPTRRVGICSGRAGSETGAPAVVSRCGSSWRRRVACLHVLPLGNWTLQWQIWQRRAALVGYRVNSPPFKDAFGHFLHPTRSSNPVFSPLERVLKGVAADVRRRILSRKWPSLRLLTSAATSWR